MVLGISCDYHDAAAALLVDGRLVAAAEEERFSRVKHDNAVPRSATESCLKIAGISAADIDVVAFYERPGTVLSRYLASRQRQGPRGLWSFARDAPTLVSRNLMVAYRIDRVLHSLGATTSPEFHYVEHHRSHAAAAFLASPHRRAAVLTVDGIGEWTTASVGRGVDGRVEVFEELHYPHSLGLLYSFVTMWCGFQPNDGEYKVMGLAPYGTPRFREALDELVELRDDGSVTASAGRLRWYGISSQRSRKLRSMLGGPPRRPEEELTQRDADLAASVQSLTEDAMLRLARHAHERSGEDVLCLAGGVALNCVANGRMLREGPFDDLWIQPAAGDAGSAVGAALSVWHEVLGRPREPSGDVMAGGFLGPRTFPDEVHAWLDEEGIKHRRETDREQLCELVAERLANGAVTGWFTGRMEFGPRALGHRSILADPRDPGVRERLNAKVKRREGFRPFAPAVLEEHAKDWFDLDRPSPYMLLVAPVLDRHLLDTGPEPSTLPERARVPRSTIPACTHVDGSARVQTVEEGPNPELHQLLTAFHRHTECPVLLNTSFNVAGEPIVASPADALRTARRAGIDLLVIEDCILEPSSFATARR